MNLNASLYANAVEGISEEYHVSEQAARVGQMIFLCSYAVGCELWAPWSEEFGRWPILQLSLLLVNSAFFFPRIALGIPDAEQSGRFLALSRKTLAL
jgi:hypothetical protein